MNREALQEHSGRSLLKEMSVWRKVVRDISNLTVPSNGSSKKLQAGEK
jgi:hypothetical protein